MRPDFEPRPVRKLHFDQAASGQFEPDAGEQLDQGTDAWVVAHHESRRVCIVKRADPVPPGVGIRQVTFGAYVEAFDRNAGRLCQQFRSFHGTRSRGNRSGFREM